MNALDRCDRLNVDELSDYVEGLVTDPARLAGVSVHVAECRICTDALAGLAAVRVVLAADVVGPMPADVAARLETALAGEAAAVLSPAAGARPTDLRTHPRAGAHRRRTPAAAVLAAAATVMAVAVGSALWANWSNGVGSGTAGGPANARRDTAEVSEPLPAGQEYDTAGIFTTASGQDYTLYTLWISARDLLAARERDLGARDAEDGGATDGPAPVVPPSASQGPAIGDPDAFSKSQVRAAFAPLGAPAGLVRCLGTLVPDPATTRPLAIDLGSYGGQPAAMLVLADPADPLIARVYLVGVRCAEGEAQTFLTTELRRG